MKRYSILEKDYESNPQEVIIVGWDLKTGEKEALNIIEEDLLCEDEGMVINLITKKEIAYSCSRYYEEEDARDEGHAYWINYHKEWKRGLGKCTVFTIDWDKSNSQNTRETKQ